MSEQLKQEKGAVKGRLTAEQKAEFIALLECPWGKVNLRCDGFDVTLAVERRKALRYVVVVYVNGHWKGEWFNGENEHPEQKFLRRVETKVYRGKRLQAMEKIYGKKRWAKDPDSKRTYVLYNPCFTTGRAAINHLCKVCESIEIRTAEPLPPAANAEPPKGGTTNLTEAANG